VRRSEPDLERQRRTRGWLGVARDLLASVVESGLNLPDAAATIRGEGQLHDFQGPPPVATVTLAEIYAAQGHYEQALRMLEEVIEREPEHAEALKVRERIAEERDLGPGRRRKVVEAKGEHILTPQAPPVALRPEPVAPPAPPPPVAEAAPPPVAEAPPPVAEAPPPVVEAAPPVAEAAPLVVEAPETPADADVEPPPVIEPAVLVLQFEGRSFVYWRVPHLSDALRLRAVSVRPTSDGAQITEEDFPVPEHVGGIWLSRSAPGTEVRAAVGDLSAAGFAPFSVARVVSSDLTAFEPFGFVPDPELDEAARLAAGL
jgi:hypothetical protein